MRREPSPQRALRARMVGLALCVGLFAGSVAGGTSLADGATPVWSVSSSPSPAGAPTGSLTAVSCASTSMCWAVASGPAPSTFFQRWNGSSWSRVLGPHPSGYNSVALNSVTCPTATSCWAVGWAATSSGHVFLVEHWNGTSWSVVASPNPGGNISPSLDGVSCPSVSNCWAVGELETTSAETTRAERWNGTSWSVVATPNSAASPYSRLFAVSCPTNTSCYAVGSFASSSGDQTLMEHWDGTSWTIIASPNPLDSTSLSMNGVSCGSDASCNAVGREGTSGADKTLVEHWDGTSWSVVASPNPGGATSISLSGVSCPSATSCNAVGSADAQSLAEHWNGTAWSITTTPNVPAGATLLGVSCPISTSCVASGSGGHGTLVERWNGGTAWSISAPPTGTSQSQLTQAACLRATNCFAVGNAVIGTVIHTLVERWDGTSWTILASPNPIGAAESELNGVSCTSATNCLAVGRSATESAGKTLVERWNGTSWTIVASPNPGSGVFPDLFDLACRGATSCWAVGTSSTGEGGATLIEHWNGTSWSVAGVPQASAGLTGISCPGATSCWAVGTSSTSGVDKTLIEHWNGTSWSVVASPNPSATRSGLHGVACPSLTSCWAVGDSSTSSAGVTSVEHWNGTSWSIINSPNPSGSSDAILLRIACPTTTSCYAVGKSYTSGAGQTLVERWTGTPWTIMVSPNPTGPVDSTLNGIRCPSTTGCFAVGNAYHVNRETDYTLVERYA